MALHGSTVGSEEALVHPEGSKGGLIWPTFRLNRGGVTAAVAAKKKKRKRSGSKCEWIGARRRRRRKKGKVTQNFFYSTIYSGKNSRSSLCN